MKRVNEFKTRIVKESKVYLLATDVRKALGYGSIDQFEIDHPDMVKCFKGLPQLVLEQDFNYILVSDKDAMAKLGHMEITRVETLRENTESLKSFYPLKRIIAGSMLEYKAFKSGFQNIEEYIEQVEFANEIEEEKKELTSKADLIDCFSETKKKLDELVDYELLDRYGLKIQQYIHINDCRPHLESFIVGCGLFFSVYDDFYEYDRLRVEDGDLIIPTLDDYSDDCKEKNYGHDKSERDYRDYSTLENLIYIVTHKIIEDVGVDSMNCEAPGISFYISQAEVIKLLNPNMYREIVLIDGCTDFKYSKLITAEPN